MSFLNDFNYDTSKARKGVWFDVEGEKASFLIAHMSEIDFLTEAEKQKELILSEMEEGSSVIPNSKMTQVSLDLVVRHRLKDWKGIEDVNGKSVKYSTAKAIEMLKVSSAFAKWVNEKSQNLQNFHVSKREEAVKK